MKISFQAKLAAAAAGSTAVLAAGGAEARLVYVDDRPIELSLNHIASGAAPSSVTWDIDGRSGPEFRLAGNAYQRAGTLARNPHRWREHTFFSGALTSRFELMNGNGIVHPNSPNYRMQALQSGFRVGRTLANYVWSENPEVHGLMVYERRVTQSPTYTCGADPWCPGSFFPVYPGGYRSYKVTAYLAASPQYGFHQGDNYIGFSFESPTGTHYGWAVLNLNYISPQSVAITSWAYQTTPNAPVTVGELPSEVPAPPAAISGLTTLALGAAGIRRLRKKKASGRSAKAA